MHVVMSMGDHAPPIRVMVLDDMPHVGRGLRRSTTFQVEMADEPERALASLEAGRIDCDVWVVDIELNATLTGFHVLDHLRRSRPTTPVIMVSAHEEGNYVRRCWQMGAYDYLIKPVATGNLAQVIREAHAKAHRRSGRLTAELASAQDVLIGSSSAMVALRQQIRQFAEQPSSVLICGETGTGKELVARALHLQSARSHGRFVPVNCGALAPDLVESELFGHVKGAFSGALADRPGLFVEANGGTLFLDEIGDMPLPQQAKLLRALQEQEVRAVGTDAVRSVDVRVIAATHIDLQKAIAAGRFRQDLFYRLNVLSLTVPPLRERMEDVAALAEEFVRKCARDGRSFTLHPSAIERLITSSWPGNVRQLENAIQHACALCTEGEILPEHLPADIETMREAMRRAKAAQSEGKSVSTLRDARQRATLTFMVKYLRTVMSQANGVVAEAARMAGLDRANFRRLLRKYKIDPGEFRTANKRVTGSSAAMVLPPASADLEDDALDLEDDALDLDALDDDFGDDN